MLFRCCTVGRGSFTEAFPLFGLNLHDYDALFTEKLDLLLAIRDNESVTWSGQFRPALKNQAIYPRPLQNPLPIWLGVTRGQFMAQIDKQGALLVGNPEEVAAKILRHSAALGGISRLTFQMDTAHLSHEKLLTSIALIGYRVAPLVRGVNP